MGSQLVIDDITDGTRSEISVIEGALVTLGREPEDGIALNSSSISGTHAYLMNHKEVWVFIDAASTNGSWVNAVKAEPGVVKVVRPGTVLQLADRAFQLSVKTRSGEKIQHMETTAESEETLYGRSVMQFKGTTFMENYAAPEYSRCVSVGSDDCQIPIAGYEEKRPALIIEDRNGVLTAYSLAQEEPFSVNGESYTSEKVALADNDRVEFREYTFLINEPLNALDPDTNSESPADILESIGLIGWQDNGGGTAAAQKEAAPSAENADVPGWGEEPRTKTAVFSSFGNAAEIDRDDEDAEEEDYGFDAFRSGAFQVPEEDPATFYKRMENRLIVGGGALLLLLILGVVGWWLVKVM